MATTPKPRAPRQPRVDRDFDAARRDTTRKPLTFRLGGKVWKTKVNISAGVIFDLADVADADGPEAYVAFRSFLGEVIDPKQRDDFFTTCRDVSLDQLLNASAWIVESVTATPTTQPSSSPARASTDGDTTSNASS